MINAATGDPVPGLTVGLASSAGQPAPVKTDAEGRFRFKDIEARAWGVTIWRGSGYFARTLVADLRATRKLTGLELKAYKAAVVSGKVQDARRRPVAGVTASVLGTSTAFGRYPPGQRGIAQTNDLGEYRISDLTPGRYRVMVEPARVEVRLRTLKDDEEIVQQEPVLADVATYYPNSSSLEGAAAFSVGIGQVLEGMDISIAREKTMCIQSRVLDPEGNNLAPIRVWVEADSRPGPGRVAGGVVGGGAGFEVCGLAPGSYRLVAGLADREAGSRYASEPFSITTRGVRVHHIYLRPLIRLPGRLTIDAEGEKRPLPGPVQVFLDNIHGTGNLDEQRFARVTQEGPFVVPAVLPDEYWLMARAPTGFYVKSATMAGVDVLRERLRAGGDELNVVLGQDGATLSGQVVDADGRPVSGAVVILGRDPLPPRLAPDDLISGVTDQSGQAVRNGIPPGDYRLLAYSDLWDDSAAVSPEFFQAHRSEGERVKLAPRENRRLQFKVLELEQHK